MSLYNAAATIVVLTFSYGYGWRYLQLRSPKCVAGEVRKNRDGCNWCECVGNGIVICSRIKCRKRGATDKLSSKNRTKNIHHHTKRCRRGDEEIRIQECVVCRCIYLGILNCFRLAKCVIDGNQKMLLPPNSDYLLD